MNNIEIVDDTVELEVENATVMGDDKVVKTYGDQDIEGIKSFLTGVILAKIICDPTSPVMIGNDDDGYCGLFNNGFVFNEGTSSIEFPELEEGQSDYFALLSQVNDKADDDEVVKLTGNQTIEGEKTFVEQMHLEMDDGTTPLIVMRNGAGDETGLGQIGFFLNYNTEEEAWLYLPSNIPGGTGTTIATDIDLASKEDRSNKVTSISSASTDDEYPSAKCVYDLIGDVESLLGGI